MSTLTRSRTDRKSYAYQRPSRVIERMLEAAAKPRLSALAPQNLNRDDQGAADTQTHCVVTPRGLLSSPAGAAPSLQNFDDQLQDDARDVAVVETPSVKKPRKAKARSEIKFVDGVASRGDAGGVDLQMFATQILDVDTTTPSRTTKRKAKAKRIEGAGGEIGHAQSATHTLVADLAINIDLLREYYYHWRQLVTQRVATINRAKSICRHAIVRHDKATYAAVMQKKHDEMSKAEKKLADDLVKKGEELYKAIVDGEEHPAMMSAIGSLIPMLVTLKELKSGQEKIEKGMAKAAKTLPAAKWVEEQKGFSLLGFAKIIGCAGDLNRFQKDTGGAAPAKLWKYMEVGMVSEPGAASATIQRRREGANALLHNYAGHKRSLMWNVGSSLIGGMGNGKRPSPGEDIDAIDASYYERLFMNRLRHHALLDPKVHAKDPVTNPKGKLCESFSLHAKKMAQRYVEKRLLKLLYLQWRRETGRDAVLDPILSEMPA